jgi:four helix bundle protein
MNEQQFKARTKKLALRIINLADALPKSIAADVIGRQILRSATSVGANYACCMS